MKSVKVLAIIGSAVFLVIAPGFVAGLVPWWISHWRLEAPFFGMPLFPFGWLRVDIDGGCGPLRFVRPIRSAGPGHTGAGLPNPPFGYYWPVSLRPKSDLRGGGEHHSRSGLGTWKPDTA